MDGEQFQIKADDDSVMKEKNMMISFFQFAAACSMTQQPGDQASTFCTMKKNIMKGVSKKHSNENNTEPEYMNDDFVRDTFLRQVDHCSRRTFHQFLRQLPQLFDHCLSVIICRHSWAAPGLNPYDPIIIIKKLPEWYKTGFTNAMTNGILQKLPTFSSKIRTQGFLSVQDMLIEAKEFLPSNYVSPIKNPHDMQLY